MKIHYYPEKLVWQKAWEKLFKSLLTAKKLKRKTLIFLSGGSVVRLYGYLRSYLSGVKQADVAFTQVDERFQPEKKEEINALQIEKSGLWEVCRQKKIPYYLVSQRGTLEESTRKYEKVIEKLFKEYEYKIAILGIGEDGHTAGLIPGYRKFWDKEKYVVGYRIKRVPLEKPQPKIKKRISLTPWLLSQLNEALVIAQGEKKREALEKVLEEKSRKRINLFPAVILWRIFQVDVFTDIILKEMN